jgi:hypothetical protein
VLPWAIVEPSQSDDITAVETLLAGKRIDVGETLPQGCPITDPRRTGEASGE